MLNYSVKKAKMYAENRCITKLTNETHGKIQ